MWAASSAKMAPAFPLSAFSSNEKNKREAENRRPVLSCSVADSRQQIEVSAFSPPLLLFFVLFGHGLLFQGVKKKKKKKQNKRTKGALIKSRMLCFAVLCIPFTIAADADADAEMMDEGRQKKMQRHGIFFWTGTFHRTTVLFYFFFSRKRARSPAPDAGGFYRGNYALLYRKVVFFCLLMLLQQYRGQHRSIEAMMLRQ